MDAVNKFVHICINAFWPPKQFLKFGLVGASNTLISLGTYYLLVHLGVYYILANTIAFAISVCNAYFWNSRYVFTKRKGGNRKYFVKTVTAYGVTVLLSTGALYLLVDCWGVSQLVAPIIGLCITIPLNFLINKFWTFREAGQE